MIPEHMKQQREEMKKLARKERNKKYYERVKESRVRCEACSVDVLPYYYATHIETTRHKKWAELRLLQVEEDRLKEAVEKTPTKKAKKSKKVVPEA